MATTIFTPSMLYGAGTRGVPEIPAGASTDSDAQAFIDAASITDATQQTAINNLVVGLKNGGIWDKMKIIYPFVGGTDTSHSYNLKDPTQYQITWTTGVTHTSDVAPLAPSEVCVTPVDHVICATVVSFKL